MSSPYINNRQQSEKALKNFQDFLANYEEIRCLKCRDLYWHCVVASTRTCGLCHTKMYNDVVRKMNTLDSYRFRGDTESESE